MEKYILFLCLAAVIGLVAQPSEARTLQQILDDGTIRVGVVEEVDAPFITIDKNGKMAGVDIDLVQGIAKQLGVDVSLVKTSESHDELTKMITAGTVDIALSNYSLTLYRAKYILFSKPYARMSYATLVNAVWRASQKKGDVSIKQLLNEANRVVGIEDSSAVKEKLLGAFPEVQVKEFRTIEEVGQALIDGEINAAFSSVVGIQQIQDAYPADALRFRRYPLPSIQKDRIAIGLSPDAFHLKYWLDQYIDMQETQLSLPQ